MNLQKIISNTGWLFFDRIFRMGIGLFVGVWIARFLGPEQFGLLSYAQAFVALFGAFAKLGLDGIVVRNIVREPDKKDQILGTTFILKLFGGLVALIITGFIIYFIRPGDIFTLWLILIIATGTLFQAFDSIDFWFQSQVISKYTVYAKSVAFSTISILKIILILLDSTLIFFALAALFEIIFGSILLVAAYRYKGFNIFDWKFQFTTAKTLLKDSWPLVLSGTMVMVYMKIDQIMLGQIIDDRAVGLYTAATRISEVWYFIPMAIVASAAPVLTKLKKDGNEEKYYQSLEKLFNIMLILGLAIALPMTLMSGAVIDLLYGKEFAPSSAVLSIHIWAAIFVFLGVVRGPWLLNEGLMKFALITTVLGAVVNIILNMIVIPIYGITGAAWTTLFSQFVASYLGNLLSPKTRIIFLMQTRAITLLFLSKRLSNKENS
ncbi:flippase [Halalkalibacterium ligniniphilum]|uniref:flippase n=1 Tax=Halalkalibacterium ligniniphilum TaxID=1134413 RepID=UPI00191C1D87|nr:flippase [Halalkalibacterium ligniniphilum]